MSCVCLQGAPPPSLEHLNMARPVSNTAAKSARLSLVDVPRTPLQYRLASIDPQIAIPMTQWKAGGLAQSEERASSARAEQGATLSTDDPPVTGALPASGDEIARSVDRIAALPPLPADPDLAPRVSSHKLCNVLADAAQGHRIPLVFFNNLIWQESRFKTRAVSPVGAQGIAQFMPYVANRVGLHNPFDPFQALPASARLLRALVEQFGNFGLAAAAYNVGPKRVEEWLSKRGRLPAETRNYVQAVTGRPAEHWRPRAQSVPIRLATRAPCSSLPDFAQADEAARQEEDARKRIAAEKARAAKAAKLAKLQKSKAGEHPAAVDNQKVGKPPQTGKPADTRTRTAAHDQKPPEKSLLARIADKLTAKPVTLASAVPAAPAPKKATAPKRGVKKVQTAALDKRKP
ncbi:MAG: lytic transglycosylase domain-containing protein [Pseudorhodoplanes sp.]